MKKTLLFWSAIVLCFGAPLTATVPPAPVISALSPVTGSTIGGTLVAITTENIDFNCPICSPPYYGTVTFGGIPSGDVRPTGTNVIYAVAPPHPAGTVDVAVTGFGVGAAATAGNSFTYVDEIFRSDYEAVLLPSPLVPVASPIPGAFGSLWATEFWLRNNGAAGALTRFGVACPLCAGPFGFPSSVAGFEQIELTQRFDAPAMLFYVQKSAASQFSYSVRARDLSRSTLNSGTAVPVVRDGAFTNGAITLLNVPIDAYSRAALRIFDVRALGETAARINVVPLSGSGLFATKLVTLKLSRPADDLVVAGFPAIPGYASIDDLRTELSLPDGRYRIEVVPLAFTGWAFVAVTNNQTQLVTTVTP